MNSLNKVQLIGNITADPEIKQTPNGQFVANFSIATNRSWKDASGTKQEQTEFTNIVIWGKLAEIVEQYASKGKKVYIEGRLQTRSWEAEDGSKRYKTEVVADSLILLGSAGGSGRSNQDEGDFFDDDVAPAKTKRAKPKQEEEIDIEDIPF